MKCVFLALIMIVSLAELPVAAGSSSAPDNTTVLAENYYARAQSYEKDGDTPLSRTFSLDYYLKAGKLGHEAARRRLVEFMFGGGIPIEEQGILAHWDHDRFIANPTTENFETRAYKVYGLTGEEQSEHQKLMKTFWLLVLRSEGSLKARLHLFLLSFDLDPHIRRVANSMSEEWLTGELRNWVSIVKLSAPKN